MSLKITDKYLIIVALISIFFLVINTYWILNYSIVYNGEDMIILGTTLNLLEKYSKDELNLNDLYFNGSQQLIPFILFLGLLIVKSEYMPLIVNTLFSIILVFSIYGIGKIIYNKKAGILAAFLVITTPIIIAYSRTMYAVFILTSLFSLNIYLYLKTDNFRNLKWSILWSLSAALSLLSKSIMISYVGALFLFAAIDLAKSNLNILKKKQYKRLLHIKQLKNFLFVCFILLLLVGPHYLQESTILSNREQTSIVKNSGVDPLSWQLRMTCDAISYPALLLNTQLGFVLFLFFIASILNIIMKAFNKNLSKNEIMILFLIITIYFFFSFVIATKNNRVTGMLIPLMVVLIAGFVFQTKKYLQLLFLLILFINGFIFILPIEINNNLNEIVSYDKTRSLLNCYHPAAQYYFNLDYNFFNKELHFGEPGLLEFEIHQKPIKEIANLISNNDNYEITFLDLSTNNHRELNFYMYIENENIDLKYSTCKDFLQEFEEDSFYNEIDFVLLSGYSYSDANKKCFRCWEIYHVLQCDEFRNNVINDIRFKALVNYTLHPDYRIRELILYKRVKIK